jgi:putative copper export protein
MKHQLVLIFHLMAATIWVGGHLFLTIRYLPKALKSRDVTIIKSFEEKFEPVGIPALLLLVITGVIMAYDYGVTFGDWFSFSNAIERVVSVKLLLLFMSLLLAIHARFFIIPKLDQTKLNSMAFHIVLVTIIGLLMLILGTFVRFGGI